MTEIANRIFQVGIEASGTPGTQVAATREWYGTGRINGPLGGPSMRNTERASYDAFHSAEASTEDFEWSYEGGLDLDDIVEQLLLSVKRGIVSTQPDAAGNPNARLWTFTPDNTAPATGTLRWDAAGDVYIAPYAMADTLEISGGVSGGDVTVSLAGPCKDRIATSALTSIADTVQRVVQGWELKFYVDAFGVAPFTTLKDAELLSFRFRISNGLARHRGASNARTFTRLTRQRRTVESEFVVDMATLANAELVNARAATKRVIGVRIGENDLISTTYFKKLDLAVAGAWTAEPIGEEGGVSTVAFSHSGVYDPTNAWAFRAVVQNTRAA